MKKSHFAVSGIIASTVLLAIFLLSVITFRTMPEEVRSVPSSAASLENSSSSLSIHISGNQLINGAGNPIRLIGLERIAGYCVKQPPLQSIIYGPYDTTAIADMAKWNINVIRLTINEDCWLGINNAPAAYSGTNYRNAIINFVHNAHSLGLYIIIDLHVNAPGSHLSAAQQAMADADHAYTYWNSIAKTFKDDPAVIFEPYNEPNITTSNAVTSNPWNCWLNGCTITQFTPVEHANPVSLDWQSAGMQNLVSTIRATGATNIISISGLHDSSDLSQLLSYLPSDPIHQLTATFHNYGRSSSQNGGCGPSCWDSVIAPVAAKMPVIADEIGDPMCQSSYTNEFMTWADQHNISYLPWGWMTWGCANYGYGLISDWTGTPNTYGQSFYNHFQALRVNPPITATSSPSIAPSQSPSPMMSATSDSTTTQSPIGTTKHQALVVTTGSNPPPVTNENVSTSRVSTVNGNTDITGGVHSQKK